VKAARFAGESACTTSHQLPATSPYFTAMVTAGLTCPEILITTGT